MNSLRCAAMRIVSPPSLSGEGGRASHRPEKCEAVFGRADAQRSGRVGSAPNLQHASDPTRLASNDARHPLLKGREGASSSAHHTPHPRTHAAKRNAIRGPGQTRFPPRVRRRTKDLQSQCASRPSLSYRSKPDQISSNWASLTLARSSRLGTAPLLQWPPGADPCAR